MNTYVRCVVIPFGGAGAGTKSRMKDGVTPPKRQLTRLYMCTDRARAHAL